MYYPLCRDMMFQKICFCPALSVGLRYCYSPREPGLAKPLLLSQRDGALSAQYVAKYVASLNTPTIFQSSDMEQVAGELVEVFAKTLPLVSQAREIRIPPW